MLRDFYPHTHTRTLACVYRHVCNMEVELRWAMWDTASDYYLLCCTRLRLRNSIFVYHRKQENIVLFIKLTAAIGITVAFAVNLHLVMGFCTKMHRN